MTRPIDRMIFRAKVALCLVLLLAPQTWLVGCGAAPPSAASGADAGWVRIDLAADDALRLALAGTAFANAVAVELHPATHRFRLVFAEGGRSVGGAFDDGAGTVFLAQLSFQSAAGAATLHFNLSRQVTAITTSEGVALHRLPAADSRDASADAATLQAFLEANAGLLDEARQIDSVPGLLPLRPSPAAPPSGGASTSSNKGDAAFLLEALLVFDLLIRVFAVAPVAVHTLVTIFTFAALVSPLFSPPAGFSNRAPIALDQTIHTSFGTPRPVMLAAVDADGDPLSFAVVTPPAHGVLSGEAPDVTYTPVQGFSGDDSFTFKANDGRADSNVAAVLVVVRPNVAPSATSQSLSTRLNTAVVVTLGGTDPDNAPAALSYSIASQPARGMLGALAGNQVTYMPAFDYLGDDTFTFLCSDGAAVSVAAAVTINVAPDPNVGWTLRATGGPGLRTDPLLAYDGQRGVAVLFAGDVGQTWEWNGSVWTQRSSDGPSPRSLNAMAYDAARGVVVLFGGLLQAQAPGGPQSPDGETWEWDGAAWTLRQVTGPAPRFGHAMFYDAAASEVVLFGGATEAAGLGAGKYVLDGETWSWDGQVWTQRSASGPSPRAGHAAAFDATRNVGILFGGTTDLQNPAAGLDGQTWQWSAGTWMQLNVTGPSPRFRHALTPAGDGAALVLFGGIVSADGGQTFDAQTWDWDGSAWRLRPLAGPSGRYGYAMAYDSARRLAVLFGGMTTNAQGPAGSDQTWEYRR